MDLAVFVVQAVLVEKRSVREVAREHGISKTWLYELLARYRQDDRAVRVLDADGEFLCEFEIDPTRTYQRKKA